MYAQRKVWFGALLLGLAVGLLAGGVRAEEKAKGGVTGTWKSTFTTKGGQTRETTFKLKQDGDKLTGTVSGRGGQETKIEDGTVKDGKVSFKVTREFNGNKVTITYKGEVKGDTIKGKTEFERDGETRSRDWEAKRAKE